MWLLMGPAWAGFFHPTDVAGHSEAYANTSTEVADQAGAVQRQARGLALALNDYESALDLLGRPADDPERAQLAVLTKQYNRDFASVQAAVDDLVTGFDTAFGAAMQRALVSHPGAQRCEKVVATGPRIPGMGAMTKDNPDCTGDDLNPLLAKSMDGDAQLRLDLDALADRALPTFTMEKAPVPAATERWLNTAAFFQAVAKKPLRAIALSDEDQRLKLEVAIEQEATAEELAALKPEAEAIDRATAAKRSTLAEPVLARAGAVFKKKAPDASWCARPPALGGCVGVDATKDLAALLRSDKKLVRSLP